MSDIGYRLTVSSDIRNNVGLLSLQTDIGRSDIKLSPILLLTDIGVSVQLWRDAIGKMGLLLKTGMSLLICTATCQCAMLHFGAQYSTRLCFACPYCACPLHVLAVYAQIMHAHAVYARPCVMCLMSELTAICQLSL
jgi:hypothetical protein